MIASHHVERVAEPFTSICDEERVRLIEVCAYGLWEKAGRPDGDAARERFWSEAEKQIVAS